MSGNLKRGVFSSILLVFRSLATKLTGLVSTLILARILLPEDFGLIAIATIVVGLMDILASTGFGQYLMRVDTLDDEKINTAYTINLIIKSILAFFGFIGSYFVAQYYDDPRLTSLICWLVFFFIAHAFRNPGLAYLRRNQQYGKIVQLEIFSKIMSVIVSVIVALVYESYWAIVAAKGTAAIVMITGSQFIYPYKRALSLKNARDQWKFSAWVVPQAIFGYTRTQLDTIVVSSTFGMGTLGSYQTMKYLAYIPNANFLAPLSTPFLVELANIKNTKNYFKKQFNASFLLLCLAGLPISVLMFTFHYNITMIFLGPNWVEYSYLLGFFGLLTLPFIMMNQCRRVLYVYAKTKQVFFYDVFSFIAVYGVVLMMGFESIDKFVRTFVLMENIVSASFFMFIVVRYTGVKSAITNIISLSCIALALFVAYQSSIYVSSWIDNIFFQTVLVTSVFYLVFGVIVMLCYLCGLKKVEEWQYLMNLFTRSIRPVFNKLGIAK